MPQQAVPAAVKLRSGVILIPRAGAFYASPHLMVMR